MDHEDIEMLESADKIISKVMMHCANDEIGWDIRGKMALIKTEIRESIKILQKENQNGNA